ncbi:MAG: DUF6756 family protein [Bacteroidota bacterium]
MFLNERIDSLKRKFSAADFRDPFSEGSNILQSIEAAFIRTKDVTKDLNNLRQHLNYWSDNIKHKIEVKTVDLNNHIAWLDKLDANTNYWAVIARRNSPALKHLVYDCKPNALIMLFAILQDDFFVVDKKYNWFSYFLVDKHTQTATIFRSGEKKTPFEQ